MDVHRTHCIITPTGNADFSVSAAYGAGAAPWTITINISVSAATVYASNAVITPIGYDLVAEVNVSGVLTPEFCPSVARGISFKEHFSLL